MRFQPLKKATFLCLALLMVIGSALPAMATQPTYQDVPTTHFAFNAINWVSDPANGAFMVGDASNNFNPNRAVSRFDAAATFALAAGFRHNTANRPQAERDLFTRSFNTYRPFLEQMAAQFPTWNTLVDREIAFLLYKDILTQDDVGRFMQTQGNTAINGMLSREEAVTWMIRLIDRSADASAITFPVANPLTDHAQINAAFRQSIYLARQLGIINMQTTTFNPVNNLTRAEMATLFYNALSRFDVPPLVAATPTPTASPTTPVATVQGSVISITGSTHITIETTTGPELFALAPTAIIMVNMQPSPLSAVTPSMTATGVVNANREILNLVVSSQAGTPTPSPTPTPTPAPTAPITLFSDEGVVTAVSLSPQSITIATQRVRLSGQIINEERTFTFAANADIYRGTETVGITSIGISDIAMFRFAGSVIHELSLIERERTIEGVLIATRGPQNLFAMPTFIVESDDGNVYELRITDTSVFIRNGITGLNWNDLRIGDEIIVDTEYDRIIAVDATGVRSQTTGRLTQINISENYSEIVITSAANASQTFVIVPGTFDVYTLRIGMSLRVMLDSREVIDVSVLSPGAAQTTSVLGYIQSISGNAFVVVEGTGVHARTRTITMNNNTTITRAGQPLTAGSLRVNMNVHVVLTGPNATTAQSITVLP